MQGRTPDYVWPARDDEPLASRMSGQTHTNRVERIVSRPEDE